MKIAHEVPILYIPWSFKYTNFDFAIAHFALEYPMYASAYKVRPKGRELIMDNGLFELSKPLSQEEVLEAAKITQADYIISPDVTFSFQKTLKKLDEFTNFVGGRYKIASVVCGESVENLVKCFTQVITRQTVNLICFSFLQGERRIETLKILKQKGLLDLHSRYHLLGVSSLEELRDCLSLFPTHAIVSLDTMKPVSATYVGEKINLLENLRGKYKRPEIDDSSLNLKLLKDNITNFRKAVHGLDR